MLPLPVARLRRRGANAKSPKDRHDHLWFAFEVSVKLALAARPPRDASALARGSLGAWIGALALEDARLSDEALLALHALLSEVGAGASTPRRAVGARELLGLFASYRNHVIGHASVRDAAFYQHAAGVLAAGLDAAWRAGLFLPPGSRLAFVDAIEVGSGGERRARLVDLSGENASAEQDVSVPGELEPRRVVLRAAGAWTVLHPWILYREEPEGCFLFNGLSRSVEYLDYATSAFLRGSAAEEVAPGITSELKARVSGSGARVEPEPSAPGDGSELGGFVLEGELGRGGMGIVYLARQAVLGRRVALKTLPAVHAENAVARARFEREVRALARCDHPNVVKVLCSGAERGNVWFAMECILGADLRAVLAERAKEPDFGRACDAAVAAAMERLAEDHPGLAANASGAANPTEDGWRRLARFFAGAARGVAHLHAKGVLHRDLAPANLMVNAADGRAVVMDLGLAAVEDASVTLTRDKDQILGTLRYLAPDQFTRKVVELDGRADVYSLGAVMHELATGAPLFDGETEAHLMRQILTHEPRPMRALRPDAPRELEAVVLQALEKRREQRQASMDVLAEQLEAIAEGRVPDAPGLKASYRARRALARQSRWIAAAALLGAGFVGSRFLRSDSTAASEPEAGGLSARQVEELKRVASPELRAKIEELLALTPEYGTPATTMARAGGARPDFGGTRSGVVPPPDSEVVLEIKASAAEALAAASSGVDGAASEASGVARALEDVLALSMEESAAVLEPLYELATRALELEQVDVARRAWQRIEASRAKAARDDNLRLQAIENHGWCLHLARSHAEAKSKLEEALVELEGNWPDAPRTQRARVKYALVAEALGDFSTARMAAELASTALESAPPTAFRDRIAAERVIARADLASGRAQEAHDRLEGWASRLETVADFPETERFDLLADLASTKRAMGDLNQARELCERVLEHRSRTLSGDHPGTLEARLALSNVLGSLGDLQGSRALQTEVLASLSRTLPDDHPDLQSTRVSLGTTLQYLGDLAGARALFEKVVAVRSATLPRSHADLASARTRLANVLLLMKEPAAARDLLVAALDAYSETMPEEHPRSLDARANLAVALRATGDERGALELRRSVLEVRVRLLPDEHPDLQDAREQLANSLSAHGDERGAAELRRKVLEVRQRTLPEDHPRLQFAREQLAASLAALGDLAGARGLCEQALETLVRSLPAQHPHLVSARARLAEVLKRMGETARAAEVEAGRWP